MIAPVEGRVRRLGDDVNTDYIISSARKRETIDTAVLKQWIFEGVDPTFAASVRPGDVIVAGRNFGCGSAMEVAVTVMAAAGINAVLAESFSRTFFRNAVNNGLIPVECDTRGLREGEQLSIELSAGSIAVNNLTSGERVEGAPLMGIALELLSAGGLVAYVLRHRGFGPASFP